jgi:hypothetical protein
LGTSALSWSDLISIVASSPPGSAIQRVIDPDWWLSPEVLLLREIEHNQRISDWKRTDDAAKKRMHSFPKQIPLSDLERRRHERETDRYQFDAISMDEARQRLGW